MKAVEFSTGLKEAGIALWKLGGSQPQVVVIDENGLYTPVVGVGHRIHPQDGPQIILEVNNG